MAKTKIYPIFRPFRLYFGEYFNPLLGPLGCSDLSPIFFGSSSTVIEWDKIVAKLSSSWLVKPSSVELSLALILVTTPTPRESRFEPLLDYLGS